MYWRSVFWKWRDIHICLCHCSCFGIFKRAMNTMTLFVLVLISQLSNPSSRPVGLVRSFSATLSPFYSIWFLSRLRKCHLKSSMCLWGWFLEILPFTTHAQTCLYFPRAVLGDIEVAQKPLETQWRCPFVGVCWPTVTPARARPWFRRLALRVALCSNDLGVLLRSLNRLFSWRLGLSVKEG